jgi:RNA polymerase sigma-70 factor (ECF subfamily)
MEQDAPTDAELVIETLAGNREVFGRLYDRYARKVRAVVAGVSGDWSAVEDMLQECFLRAYRNLARLREPQRFGPWIVGIARQVGRERRRSLRRDRHEFRDPRLWGIETAANAELEADERDQLELVMRKLNGLEERERVSMAKTYYWVPELPSTSAADIGQESPITRLRMVREGTGEVLRELGTKFIDGKYRNRPKVVRYDAPGRLRGYHAPDG